MTPSWTEKSLSRQASSVRSSLPPSACLTRAPAWSWHAMCSWALYLLFNSSQSLRSRRSIQFRVWSWWMLSSDRLNTLFCVQLYLYNISKSLGGHLVIEMREVYIRSKRQNDLFSLSTILSNGAVVKANILDMLCGHPRSTCKSRIYDAEICKMIARLIAMRSSSMMIFA